MRGSVEIYQSYQGENKLLLSQDNLIVDGGRELIASMMSHRNNPSALASNYAATGADSVSSFQINAITLGCAKDYFKETLTRFSHDISGYGAKFSVEDYLNGHGNFVSANAWVVEETAFAGIVGGTAMHVSGTGADTGKRVKFRDTIPNGFYKVSFEMSGSEVGSTNDIFFGESASGDQSAYFAGMDGHNEFYFYKSRLTTAPKKNVFSFGIPDSSTSEWMVSSMKLQRMDADRHCLLPMNDRDFIEASNHPRKPGPNQWKYVENLQTSTRRGPNILENTSFGNWLVDSSASVERTSLEDGDRFTYMRDSGKYIIRKNVPIILGSTYTFKVAGKSTGLPLEARLYRGVFDERREVLDFDTGEFVKATTKFSTKETLGDDRLRGRGSFDNENDWYSTGVPNSVGEAASNVSGYFHVSSNGTATCYSYTTSASMTGSRKLEGFTVENGKKYKVEFDVFDYYTDPLINTGNISIWLDGQKQASPTGAHVEKVHPGRNSFFVTYEDPEGPSTSNSNLDSGVPKYRGSFMIGIVDSESVNLKIKNLTVREVLETVENPTTRKTLLLDNVEYDTKSFTFKVGGFEKDQTLSPYQSYWLEVSLPPANFEDSKWNPMTASVVDNIHVDIKEVSLLDHNKQILKNPNFNQRTTEIFDGSFKSWGFYNEQQVGNPGQCVVLGIKNPVWWKDSSSRKDQQFPIEASSFGSVREVNPVTAKNTEASAFSDGLVLTTSSMVGTDPGFAGVNQIFSIDKSYDNWLVSHEAVPGSFINEVKMRMDNGHAHKNGTMCVTFDMLANPVDSSSLGSASLSVDITRLSDGKKYCFSPDDNNENFKQWTDSGVSLSAIPTTPNSFERYFDTVEFEDPLAKGAYSISIKGDGTGDVDGSTNTFVNYFIRNISVGRLKGWDMFTYGYGNSQGTFPFTKVGLIPNDVSERKGNDAYFGTDGSPSHKKFSCNGDSLYMSSQGDLTSRSEFNVDDYYDFTKTGRTELVQRFVGLRPRKKYQMVVKGTSTSNATSKFRVYLKAYKGGLDRSKGFNLVRDIDITQASNGEVSSTAFNEYGVEGTSLQHPYTAAFDSRIKVDQSCVKVTTSIREEFRVNSGQAAILEMESCRESSEHGYLVLSSIPQNPVDDVYFWNWESKKWQSENEIALTYGDSRWYLPFAGNGSLDFQTDYHSETSQPQRVTFLANSLTSWKDTSVTPNGLGRLGDYVIAATAFATDSTEDTDYPIYLKKFKLLGGPPDAAVTSRRELWYNFAVQEWQTAVSYFEGVEGFDSSSVGIVPTIANMHSAGLDEDTIYQLNFVDSSGGSTILHEIALQDISLGLNDGLGQESYREDSFTSESEQDLGSRIGYFLKSREPGTYVALDDNGTFGNVNSKQRCISGVYCPGVIPSHTKVNDDLLAQVIPAPAAPEFGLTSKNLPFAVVGSWRNIGTSRTSSPIVTYYDKLGNLAMNAGDNLAYGVEIVNKYGSGNNNFPASSMSMEYFVGAIEEGESYFFDWDSKTWTKSKAPLYVSGPAGLFSTHRTDVSAQYYALTPKVKIPPFSENSDIIFGIRPSEQADNPFDDTKTFLRVIKRYQVTESGDWWSKHMDYGGVIPTSGIDYRVSSHYYFPEFPTPMDDTLQSTSPGAGDLGHFMNRGQWYNFSSSPENPHLLNHSLNPSKTGERDLEEAVRNGAFIPSAGYWIPGWVTLPARSGIQSKEMGYVSGVLNAWQTVNSDGYIYRHPENPSDGTWEDTSAGLVVSSIRDTSIAGGETSTAREGAKELRYILRVTKDQWRVMDDIFGGIGTMGLHGIDWDKTVEKLGAGPFLQASSTHVPGGNFTSLYNLGNPSQNPVFKLFSKKVLFPPGLHIDYSTTDYVTIIWKIKL